MRTLTTREQQVFEQMGFDKTNQQIAETLDIKLGTVKAHKKSIRIKQSLLAAVPLEDERCDDPGPRTQPE